jgi:putative endopeptidase
MAEEKIPGIILENMDTSVSPKEDFYNYVNGNWVKTNTIPDDESRWGGFGVLRKSTRQDVLNILNTSINWQKLMDDMGIDKKVDTLLVKQPKYMKAMDAFLKAASIEDVKTLMTWNTLDNAAALLTTDMEKANWDFYGKTLNGSKKMRPVDERTLGTVDGSVGEAIGQLYVQAKFPPEAKEKAEKMITNVIAAFQNRINNLDWMTEETKKKAIEKLDKFTVKIAYPDEWEDYSSMQIEEGNSYAENMLAVGEWAQNKNMAEINEPVGKSKWGMAPQTANAYFNPLNNEIVFPAAILQPPFYNYTADETVNYGGISAVIGHEISYAFDDSGARFDGDGNVNNWWIPEDLTEFEKRGKSLADQYSAIEVLDSVYVNGPYTLGENIGDLGGVLGAYDGLQLYFKENGKPDAIDGFSAEQRFFMSWATVWRTITRDEALRRLIKTDTHSPGIVRATQPLKNIDAFYEAFDIKEGDGMYLAPENRVRIW